MEKFKKKRPWTFVEKGTDVGWLKNYNDLFETSNPYTFEKNLPTNNGPGEGEYILYVRAVDPAGNVDEDFKEGRNMYTWTYSPTPPYLLILLLVSVVGSIVMAAFVWYRRRMRQLALERYAMKRIRRKFKGMVKEGEVDPNDPQVRCAA